MGRLTVEIDDDLLQSTQELLGTKTKRETIIVALEDARRAAARKRLLEHAGQLELGFTLEELFELRRRG